MLEVETGLSRQKEEFAMKIDSLNQRREELQRKEQQLKDSLFKFEKFLKVRYLESVLEHSQDFDEIKDIISRYDTLAASNQELLERSRHAQEKTHLLRLQFQNQTQIARLQAKLEESVLKTQRHQQELDQFLMHQSQKSLELGQVKMAISNLFMVVRNHLNGRLQGGDIRNMLDKIGQFLVDMTAITQESAQE
ncbi:hypothetical protein EDD86DRAFT_233305 [Gorgonomyces haynaldii]|nr:hypothetical protein EDD86DRAFT_233305 [Gorgonomyces haynaldii]